MKSDLAGLLESCRGRLQSAERVFVGYSGGLDSTVLLCAATDLLGPDKICALHANHQLQPESDNWQTHCQSQADKLGLEIRVARLEIGNKGQGIENEARQLRYQFFRENLKPGDILLLGHHLDDQAETLLYRLFRGAGARGLAAIPLQRSEGDALLIRPLLGFARDDLRAKAQQLGLKWIEDSSNSDTGYDRNYIRANVLPAILERWPAAKSTLARAATNLTSATVLLDEYGADLLIRCDWQKANWGYSFDIASYEKLSFAAKTHLLAKAFQELGLSGFDSRYGDKVDGVISSAEDKTPLLIADGSELRRFANRLYLMPRIPPLADQNVRMAWSGRERLEIEGTGYLKPLTDQDETFFIGFRQGGERCKPVDRDRSQSLKKLLQEYSVEPWLRDRVPLVWRDNNIVAVAGCFSCLPELAVPRLEWNLG